MLSVTYYPTVSNSSHAIVYLFYYIGAVYILLKTFWFYLIRKPAKKIIWLTVLDFDIQDPLKSYIFVL
jgi:hypothetical protein